MISYRCFKVFLLTLSVLYAPNLWSLSCNEVRILIMQYNKLHYSQKSFTDEISGRTLKNFIRAWDPGKIYFLESDIKEFENKYGNKLDDMIKKKNCTAIDTIVNRFAKRFEERYKEIPKLLALKHDFTLDEYMIIDRKALPWAKNPAELYDRWRKRIKYQYQQLKQSVDAGKIPGKLKKRYELAKKRHLEMDSTDLYGSFINAFSSSLDPHSGYLPPANLEDFRIRSRLSLEGIGAMLRSEDGFTKIQELVPGGAAFKTGKVKAEDKIVAVAEGTKPPVDVIDMDLREVVKLIRGPKGTEVRLTIMRDSKEGKQKLIVPIIREKVELKDAAAKSKVYKLNVKNTKGKPEQYKVGVIDLPSFYMDFQARHQGRKDYRSASRDMIKEIEMLKKEAVDSIVVDLRSNGGGSLDESIKVAGLFFDKGPVVQTKGFADRVLVQSDRDGITYYDGPLVVMIDRQSASASEIFAGAIKDFNRGLVVGDHHTFGKGTVQTLNDDMDPKLGAIKVTISKFYTPSGSSTQKNGVESHIILPSLMDEYEVGEKYYDYALEWEKIPKAEHKNYGLVNQYVDTLKAASSSRVKTQEGFDEVFKAIKEYKENKTNRTKVSLKEEKEKDKKAEKKEEEKEDKPANKEDGPNLQDDIYLQETLRIATDYIRLLNKKPLAEVTIEGLKDQQKSAPKK